MIDPAAQLQALLQGGDVPASPFPPNSRYHGVAIAAGVGPRRTDRSSTCAGDSSPPPERFAVLQEHTVVQGDRLDNLAARYLGDPEQFWRLCDANAAMRPQELTETIGRPIRITLPEGMG